MIVSAPDRPVVRAPIWIVGVGGDLYVRSWKGDQGRWYRRARRYGAGVLAVGGEEYAVRFVPVADAGLDAAVDEAYRGKYRHSPYAEAMTRAPAAGTTLRVEPVS